MGWSHAPASSYDALSRFDAPALVDASMLADGDFGLIFTQVEWSDGVSSYIAPYTQSADDGSVSELEARRRRPISSSSTG